MAHNLATIREKIAMAYSGEVPWHRLGIALDPNATLADVLVAASLDYDVTLSPLFLEDGTLVDCRQAVLGDGKTILGTVGRDYRVIQNSEAFAIAEPLMGEGGMTFEAAGALGRGETAWLLLRNGAGLKVGSEEVKTFLAIVTGHVGNRGLVAIPTGVRTVCENTLNMIRERFILSVQHTGDVKARIEEARKLLKSFARVKETTEETYQRMAQTPLTADELIAYWETVFPEPKKTKQDEAEESRLVVAELLNGETGRLVGDLAEAASEKSTAEERREVCAELLVSGRGQDGTANLWTAYNAVTEYVDHVFVNKQDGTPRKAGAQSALFGYGAKIRAGAWDAALARLN